MRYDDSSDDDDDDDDDDDEEGNRNCDDDVFNDCFCLFYVMISIITRMVRIVQWVNCHLFGNRF